MSACLKQATQIYNRMKKIIGIGNALVDILATLNDDDVLAQLGLPKGGMTLIDDDRLPSIRQVMDRMTTRRSTGGSAGNTMLALACLNAAPSLIGCVGDDATGHFFADNAKDKGIEPRLFSSTKASGTAYTFISPDGERTFGTYLGAAATMEADMLRPELFRGYDYLYIEGYLVQNHDLILTAARMAREEGLKICLDMASYNIVAADHDFFTLLLTDYVDIVFANEEEARAFAHDEPAVALEQLAALCDIAVVKLGGRGSVVKRGTERAEAPSMPGGPIVDTTGAGDFYAAGFMYGIMNGWPLSRCAHAGAILAGHVIRTIGTAMTDEEWKAIRTQIGID